MVRLADSKSDSYRPVQAASFTGTFPGFVRPHFTPDSARAYPRNPNTIYIQHVLDERIIAFEPLEQIPIGTILSAAGSAVQLGDAAVYAYAFAPNDVVAGTREVVAQAIEARFSEIEPKEFAASTAAQFAKLFHRLPDVNRRAFKLLSELDMFSAQQWRDSTVFHSALTDELTRLGVRPEHVRIMSEEKDSRLHVILSLRLDHSPQIPRRQVEDACGNLLTGTGLFGKGDVFSVSLDAITDDLAVGQLRLPDGRELDAVLKEAKLFLEEKVFLPALREGSERTLNVVRYTRKWIARFQKIGDLIRYMDRFRPDTKQERFSFAELKEIRFEDVYDEFIERFGTYRGFQTTIADFKQGESYSPFTLSIYTRTYDNRSGGIRPVGKIGKHEAVVVNIALSESKYANEWLEEGKRLKCYMKALRTRSEGQYDESHDANRSIMKYPDIPVLVFTRSSPRESSFVYQGVFKYVQVLDDENGKWFELVKLS